MITGLYDYCAKYEQMEKRSIEIFESIGASMYYDGSKKNNRITRWQKKTSFYTIDEVYSFARDLENSIENELKKLKFNALLNSDDKKTKEILSKFNYN